MYIKRAGLVMRLSCGSHGVPKFLFAMVCQNVEICLVHLQNSTPGLILDSLRYKRGVVRPFVHAPANYQWASVGHH